jgi:hypothetical protein
MNEAQIMQQARDKIQQGDRATAQTLLLQAIRLNGRNEVAWLWLSAIVDDTDKERECLERVIAINPGNAVAQRHLERLAQQAPPTLTPDAGRPPQAAAQPAQASTPSAPPALLELYGAGFVLPCISPTFFYHATRRRVSSAIWFFLLFALALTTVQTLDMFQDLGTFGQEIGQGFTSGRFPEITISRGRATIRGTEPFVLELGDSILILDTTNQYTAAHLRSGRYNSGILLTETKVYSLDDGELNSIELRELQAMLGDPFVIDAGTIQKWLNWLQVVISVVLILRNTVGQLVYLTLVALIVWGVATAVRRGTRFAPVFVTGVYALVPAVYGSYLLKRARITFCGQHTILLLTVWAIGLIAALSERKGGIVSGERPLRPWRALVGVPMLLVLALDKVFSWPSGAIVSWGITLLTLATLAFIGLWPILGSEKDTG